MGVLPPGEVQSSGGLLLRIGSSDPARGDAVEDYKGELKLPRPIAAFRWARYVVAREALCRTLPDHGAAGRDFRFVTRRCQLPGP